ncbi:MAG: Flp family type IVb pilin [Chloroflexi bacterium]|nr:Flp family type IVb pilin [Chloroflexota bacterium]
MMERAVTREEGQDLAEYGLILALIAIVAIGALTLLGGRISSVLRSVALRL